MKITEVRISLCNEDRLKAFANVTFDDEFVVRGLKIIEGHNGLFVSMPSRRRSNGTYQDIAHPITSDMRARLESEVISTYEDELETAGRQGADQDAEKDAEHGSEQDVEQVTEQDKPDLDKESSDSDQESSDSDQE